MQAIIWVQERERERKSAHNSMRLSRKYTESESLALVNCDFSLFAKCFGWLEKWVVWLFILPCCCYNFREHFYVFVHTNAYTDTQPKWYGPTGYSTLIKYLRFLLTSLFCSFRFFRFYFSFCWCVGWFCSIDSLSNVGAFVNVYMFLRLPYSAFSFVIWSATNRFVTLLSIIE